MTTQISQELIDATISFHGHWCPGLAIGIRVAEWALQEMGRATDEEIVALVETDMCGVDAIQYLTGCTFGKGNLIHLDYGKNAFSFYRRRDRKARRLVTKHDALGHRRTELTKLQTKMKQHGLSSEETSSWKQIREDMSKRIMSLPLEDLFIVKEPTDPAPAKARILSSLICEACGEAVMESRSRRFQEKTLCIPCFKAQESRN